MTREKLLASLERDKAISEVRDSRHNTVIIIILFVQVECLQSTLHSLRPSSYPPSTITRTPLPQRPHPLPPISHSNQPLSQDEAIPNKVLFFSFLYFTLPLIYSIILFLLNLLIHIKALNIHYALIFLELVVSN